MCFSQRNSLVKNIFFYQEKYIFLNPVSINRYCKLQFRSNFIKQRLIGLFEFKVPLAHFLAINLA